MKNTFQRLAYCATFVWCSVHAQDDTGPRRYLNEVFTETVRTGDVIYQEAFNDASGKNEKLTLRVYEPKADTAAKRPLIVITPGGGFVKHDDHWMDEFAEPLARAGYVVALNRYRLANSISSADEFFNALAKAHSDQRAAIRYFINDAKGANRYRIDPQNIFIGGHSAGAITSLYTAYLDASESIPEPLQNALKSQGGYNGKGGEHDEFKIRGVINLSGMITDLNLIDANEPALLSIHGDQDSVVKIEGSAGQFGSIPIDQRAQNVGLAHQLYVVRGGLHNDTSLPVRCPECVPLVRRFVFNHLTSAAN